MMFISKAKYDSTVNRLDKLFGTLIDKIYKLENVKKPTIKMKSPEWKKDYFWLGGGPPRFEVPISEALQLIVDHLDLRYAAEVEKITPAKIVKAKRERKS